MNERTESDWLGAGGINMPCAARDVSLCEVMVISREIRLDGLPAGGIYNGDESRRS